MPWDQISADLYRHQTLDWVCQLESGQWILKQNGGFKPTLVMPSDLPPPLASLSSAATGNIAASWSMTATALTLLAGSVLTVKGSPVVIASNTTADFSGGGYAAGWYFAGVSAAGGLAFRKVQAGEIVADTVRYSPTPAFDATVAEYFPAVFPAMRAAGAVYWDGAAILHWYPYGAGRRRNDSRILVTGSQAVSSSGRARFGSAPTYQHGDDVLSWADDATAGTRLTVQRPGLLFVSVFGFQSSGSNQLAVVTINTAAISATSIANVAQNNWNNGVRDECAAIAPVQPGDLVGFGLAGGAQSVNDATTKLLARLQELP